MGLMIPIKQLLIKNSGGVINTMASRDLTSAFIERRNAANLRRRTSDNSGGSRMKPFGA